MQKMAPVELDLSMRWITSATWSFSTHSVTLQTEMMFIKSTKMTPNIGILLYGSNLFIISFHLLQ